MMNFQLSQEIYLSSPNGWIVDGKMVLPFFAYTSPRDWIIQFESIFPEKKTKMRSFSAEKGWNEYQHINNWLIVCLRWLRHREDRKTK